MGPGRKGSLTELPLRTQAKERTNGQHSSCSSCQFFCCINNARVSVGDEDLQELKDDRATQDKGPDHADAIGIGHAK
jgi:hypothetical protein